MGSKTIRQRDNLLVNSTDTNIQDARVCHTTPFFRFTDRLHAAGTALFFEDDFDWIGHEAGRVRGER